MKIINMHTHIHTYTHTHMHAYIKTRARVVDIVPDKVSLPSSLPPHPLFFNISVAVKRETPSVLKERFDCGRTGAFALFPQTGRACFLSREFKVR